MAIIESCLTWFNIVERNIWGSKIESNRFFATSALSFIFFSGAVWGSAETIQRLSGMTHSINGVSVVALWVILTGFLVCESICAANEIVTAITRSIAVVITALFMLTMGHLLSAIGIIITLAWCTLPVIVLIQHVINRRR